MTYLALEERSAPPETPIACIGLADAAVVAQRFSGRTPRRGSTLPERVTRLWPKSKRQGLHNTRDGSVWGPKVGDKRIWPTTTRAGGQRRHADASALQRWPTSDGQQASPTRPFGA